MEALVYTAEEVAELLSVTRRFVYDLAKEGVIPSIRLGRRVVFPRHAVHQFVGLPDAA